MNEWNSETQQSRTQNCDAIKTNTDITGVKTEVTDQVYEQNGNVFEKNINHSTHKRSLIRRASDRITSALGRRKASASNFVSGVYENPWDQSAISGNIRNPMSRFYIDIEDSDEEDTKKESTDQSATLESTDM